MNTVKLLMILALPFLFVSSKCNDKEPIIFVVTGRIMNSCTSPASNVQVTLKSLSNLLGSEGIRAEGITDSNGYFRIEYEPSGVSYSLRAPYEVMENIQVEQNLDLGEIVREGSINFVIKLDVQNPYTVNDTLYYYNRNYPHNSSQTWLKIPGPFDSGVLDTVLNASYMQPQIYNHPMQLYVSYYINNHLDNKLEYFDVSFCNNSFFEVTIPIE